MNPIDFPQANRTFTRPAGMTDEECGSLRVHDTGGQFVSCWQPTEEERAAIAAGAPVWLGVAGSGHPPVAIWAEKELGALKDETPATGIPPPHANDVDAMQREIARLCQILGPELAKSPGWTFAVFLFEDKAQPHNGHVLCGSRDRGRTLPAVATWVLNSLEAAGVKARS